MRLWSIQPLAVWEALEASEDGKLFVDPDHEGVWQEFRTAYEWLAKEMKKRIPGYQDHPNGYPWWAWTIKPDMRREIWHCAKGNKFVLIEITLPTDQICLTDFDIWNIVLSKRYVSWNDEEQDTWDAEWETRFGKKHWKKEEVSADILAEHTARVEESWLHVFDFNNPNRDPEYWGEVEKQATFGTLDKSQVVKVSHHVGRKDRSKK